MQIITRDKFLEQGLYRFLSLEDERYLSRKVHRIVQEVRLKGDLAVRKYTREFDCVEIPAKRFRVTEGDINRAFEKVDRSLVPLLKQVQENAKSFYEKGLPKNYSVDLADGAALENLYSPLERVGVYVPGGTAPLVSSVYMTVIPALAAGVKEIILASPPNRETGDIDPHILAVANLLGVHEIYRAGGAQAIAAMAFGTKLVKKVDKIVGPGNQYVSEAKRQVYGFVDIDMVAGPSEIVIIADQSADPDLVTCDLLAQTEHFGGVGILITDSRKMLEVLKKRIDTGYCILVDSLVEACEVANLIAPEHLEILTKRPESLLRKIRNAGAVFLGPYSPVTVGDYVAGPSHVLPTGGSARRFSPLSAASFMKATQVIAYTREALEKSRENIRKITQLEGLVLHGIAVEARFHEKKRTKEGAHEEK